MIVPLAAALGWAAAHPAQVAPPPNTQYRIPTFQLSIPAPILRSTPTVPSTAAPSAPRATPVDPDEGYVPWLIAAHGGLIGIVGLSVIVTPLPVLLLPLGVGLSLPAAVHGSYGEPGRAWVTVVGSSLFLFSGLLVGHLAAPFEVPVPCTLINPDLGQCDYAPVISALVFQALWATMDVTTVLWNPRTPRAQPVSLQVLPTRAGGWVGVSFAL